MRRVLVVAVVMCGALWFARAETPPFVPRTAPLGFDHTLHARDVHTAAAPEIACTRCHVVRAGALVGKPGHAACFGACHGPPPTARDPVAPPQLRLCNPCHAETALATPANKRALAVTYPPYVLGLDFALQIGHKAHQDVTCAKCHDKRTGPPHKRCIACHDGAAGKGFAMTACSTCHTPGSGQPDPPKLLRTKDTQIFVTTAFSHAKHSTRGAARQCTACHATILETNDRRLPRPTAETCAISGCHDGKASFPITTSCTKCHKDVPARKFEVRRPEARFSHAGGGAGAAHETTGLACAACHPLGKTGEALVAGHAPCATCHAKDFGLRTPTICGACHIGTEPWRPLVADNLPAETTEFGVTLQHRKHPGACSSCHSLTTSATQLRPPRGHRACTTSGCHAITGGPAPQLADCESCHQRGLAEQRDRTRLAATWSVRAKFVHAPHAMSKDAEVACIACHTDLSSPTVLSLAVPTKTTCAPCHDGQVAFKLTGTTCTRCHPGAAP